MNADEIAQEFEDILKEAEERPWGNFEILYDNAATMLRQFGLAESIIKQQQIEIEALNDEIKACYQHIKELQEL
jgi:hypothetical protein